MKILFIGDIFGNTGIRAIKTILPNLKTKYKIDFTIANAENTTMCSGLCIHDYNELMKSGIDFFTMGNHTWKQEDIYELLNKSNIIRPGNVCNDNKYNYYGVGSKVIYINNLSIRITNLLGNSVYFKKQQTNPFIYLNNLIENNDQTDFHIIDFHAETTSEKNALLYAFKGKVSAIFGTHTHIQTADNKIVNNTAYITDVGSTGSIEGIIGASAEEIINMYFNNQTNFQIKDAGGKFQFCGVILELDELKKIPIKLERIFIYE